MVCVTICRLQFMNIRVIMQIFLAICGENPRFFKLLFLELYILVLFEKIVIPRRALARRGNLPQLSNG